jgi:hypothetical protein
MLPAKAKNPKKSHSLSGNEPIFKKLISFRNSSFLSSETFFYFTGTITPSFHYSGTFLVPLAAG